MLLAPPPLAKLGQPLNRAVEARFDNRPVVLLVELARQCHHVVWEWHVPKLSNPSRRWCQMVVRVCATEREHFTLGFGLNLSSPNFLKSLSVLSGVIFCSAIIFSIRATSLTFVAR